MERPPELRQRHRRGLRQLRRRHLRLWPGAERQGGRLLCVQRQRQHHLGEHRCADAGRAAASLQGKQGRLGCGAYHQEVQRLPGTYTGSPAQRGYVEQVLPAPTAEGRRHLQEALPRPQGILAGAVRVQPGDLHELQVLRHICPLQLYQPARHRQQRCCRQHGDHPVLRYVHRGHVRHKWRREDPRQAEQHLHGGVPGGLPDRHGDLYLLRLPADQAGISGKAEDQVRHPARSRKAAGASHRLR